MKHLKVCFACILLMGLLSSCAADSSIGIDEDLVGGASFPVPVSSPVDIERQENETNLIGEKPTLAVMPSAQGGTSSIVEKDELQGKALSITELERFNNEVFNTRDPSSPGIESFCLNRFLFAGEFDEPANIDLYRLFYDGFGPHPQAGKEEEAAAFAIWEYDAPMDCCRITTKEMDEVLISFTGLSLDETHRVNLDQFIYLHEYDAYYCFHGDAGYENVKIITGFKTEDGLIILKWQPQGMIQPDTIEWISVLQETETGFWFISNRTVVSDR